MNPSVPSKPYIEPQSLRVRPKIVTAYLILSLIVTALEAFVYFIVATPLGGLKLEPLETIPYFILAVVYLGCLVSTIALFFWRKWAALAFYTLLGLSLLWYGYAFFIQEEINAANISGFFFLAVFPILLFRWVIQKIWLHLI
jgi:hypothetical protein